MTPFLFILLSATSLLLIVITLVTTFTARRYAPLLALAALLIVMATPTSTILNDTAIFWGAASLIAAGINLLLPADVANSRVGVPYMAGGAIVGACVSAAISLSVPSIILGAVCGALLGAIAFSRTPAGAKLSFPSRRFFNYLCAKALPAIVSVTVLAIALINLVPFIRTYSTFFN